MLTIPMVRPRCWPRMRFTALTETPRSVPPTST